MFDAIKKSIDGHINKSDFSDLHINGIGKNEFNILLHEVLLNNNFQSKCLILLLKNNIDAEQLYQQTKEDFEGDCFYLEEPENSPYLGFVPSEALQVRRFFILQKLLKAKNNTIIFTTPYGLLQKLPPKNFFSESALSVKVGQEFAPNDLAEFLVEIGYIHDEIADTPGTFCKKGEIFDVFPFGKNAYRLHYFDDEIEAIYPIDAESQRTLRDQKIDDIEFPPSFYAFTKDEYVHTLREHIPMPQLKFKNKINSRKEIFSKLSKGQLFPQYPNYIPFFFKEKTHLFDYINKDLKPILIYVDKFKVVNQFDQVRGELHDDYIENNHDLNSPSLLPAPDTWLEDINLLNNYQKIAFNEVATSLDQEHYLDIGMEAAKSFLKRTISEIDLTKMSLELVLRKLPRDIKLVICFKNISFKGKILDALKEHSIHREIDYRHISVENGLYYKNEKLLFLSEGDFKPLKVKKYSKSQTNPDLFAEQIASLKKGDYVIHNQFGIGLYHGMETMSLGGQDGDFLIIEYANNDKVYLPVYKINLLQKYASATAEATLHNLRTNKFEKAKQNARNAAKKLAFDLLELEAKRKVAKAFAFSPPDEIFNDFEDQFPYQLTNDQIHAVEDVLKDMQSDKPMDRLICGDVGFGKTEVAMRAAFKAVLDKKQVVVLVPTTILALQHYHSFKKRFASFPVTIDFLSRFKNAKQSSDVFAQAEEGTLDIIIGTHKLLSKNLKFKNLGLVIVDEEQRFGVGHKETLKSMKESLDFLTLTATPIPRTLQLSFMGLKDLSLIQTPPPKRQAIRSYVIEKDQGTLKQALEKELKRGGQIFYVHNRVQNIDSIQASIKELVPTAKTIIAHGQLTEADLERRISAFYKGEYDILISTTIIESGIDIPNANTMIVNNANHFGLSQLHQLRGRIGRSDKKAYAYFIVDSLNKLTDVASKRLKALQTFADIGSGFAIASSDLEIRGTGDILGAEQSGHINGIGLELYMELLNEAIHELKGKSFQRNNDIEVHYYKKSTIPENYIQNSSQRLRFYKKIANCNSIDQLDNIATDLYDIYGTLPTELESLIFIIKNRVILNYELIKSINISQKSVSILFNPDILSRNLKVRDRILAKFLTKDQTYKLTPEFKLVYKPSYDLTQEKILSFCKDVAQQIDPC